MSNNRHPLVMFKVTILLAGNKKGNEMFCIGINDVYKFVEYQRLQIGLRNYSGYSSEAVPLSSYSASVIKKGVEILNV